MRNQQTCWQPSPEMGFLIQPSPLPSLADYLSPEIAQHLDSISATLSTDIAEGTIRQTLDKLPIYDVTGLIAEGQSLAIERACQLYCYFASTYVFMPNAKPATKIPAGVAIPLVQLSDAVERPPILSYAPYTLANWQKIDPHGDIVVDNLRLLQKFIDKRDAAWFTLIHVDIEKRAAPAVGAIPTLLTAVAQNDHDTVSMSLMVIHDALLAMMTTLKRMPEHCHPQVYYHEVRPYIFGFEDVIYEGVEKFGGKAQSFRGETGAQSAIIPALVRALGLSHEETSMTQHLRIMQGYMPRPHRDFIISIDGNAVRGYIVQQKNTPLRDVYNETLQQLLAFRKMHLRFAASYIANQSADSLGTGGTDFMHWLQQLIDETQAHLITS
ncbi:MAG: hypothetical protein AAFR67_01055 [Chloroflexota bacterium]